MNKLLGMVAPALGGFIGRALDGDSRKKDLNHSKELGRFNQKLGKDMGKFNMDLAMKYWEDTNYKAQIEQMIKAGLNPASMFGMAGQGGQTMNVGAKAEAGGNPNQPQIQGIGMQTATQALMASSQIKLNEAQAEKTTAEAEKISGVDTTQVEAQTLNTETQTRLTSILADINADSKADQVDYKAYQVEQLIKDIREKEIRNEIQGQSANDQIKMIKEQSIGQVLQNALTKVQTQKSEAEINKIANEITQGWEKIRQQNEGLILQAGDNKRKLLDGKAQLSKIENDFILGIMSKDIDLMKLNVEQQKVFAQMFSSILKQK